MVKQLLFGFEREHLNNRAICGQCSEAITNPLCHNCLGNQILAWLSFYPNLKRKLAPKIKSYVKQVNNLSTDALNCVSCKKKKAALCPYCFSEGVLNIFKKNNMDKYVLGDFLTIFNFDTQHEGYIADAINEGLY